MRLAGAVVLGQPESSRAERNRGRNRDFFMIRVLEWMGERDFNGFGVAGQLESYCVLLGRRGLVGYRLPWLPYLSV